MIYRLHPFWRQVLYWDEIHGASHHLNEPWSMSFTMFSPLVLSWQQLFSGFLCVRSSHQYEPLHPVGSVSESSKGQNLCPTENPGISTPWFLSASLGLSDNSGFRAELYFMTSPCKCYYLLWRCFFTPGWKMQHNNCRKALKIEVWNCSTSTF